MERFKRVLVMEDEPIDYEVKDLAWHLGLGPKDDENEIDYDEEADLNDLRRIIGD